MGQNTAQLLGDGVYHVYNRDLGRAMILSTNDEKTLFAELICKKQEPLSLFKKGYKVGLELSIESKNNERGNFVFTLPFRIREKISDNSMKSGTFIRHNQFYSGKSAILQITQEICLGFLILPTFFRNAENFPIPFIIDPNCDKDRYFETSPPQLRLR